MPSRATLSVGGSVFDAWTTMRVTKSLGQIADTFSFDLRIPRKDRFADALKSVRPGEDCVVSVAGKRAITGIIDDLDSGYTAKSRTISLVGRSKTGQLIDCSSQHKTGGWQNVSIVTIAQDVCRPLGVTVTSKVTGDALSAFGKFRIEPNESVADTILRAARLRGVILNTSPDGNLVLDLPETGVAPYPLNEDNILACSSSQSLRDRYSEIAIVGQYRGNDVFSGDQAAGGIGRFTDPNVPLYRPRIIIAMQHATSGDMENQAAYEGNRRAAKAQSVKYMVNGWGSATSLWSPNQVVSVSDEESGITESMLIEHVTYSTSTRGDTTEIGITRLGAYTTEPIPTKERKKWAS